MTKRVCVLKKGLAGLASMAVAAVLAFGGPTAAEEQDVTAVSDVAVATESTSGTIWREVPIVLNENSRQIVDYFNFDLKENVIKYGDFIFKGTVVSRKEYEVEWTENGEKRGPYDSSVIEVKVNKVYYGDAANESDTIKVYYPYSLSIVLQDMFFIKDDSEYIFVTNVMDDEFIERKKRDFPGDKYEQEKHADVYLYDGCNFLMSVDNGTVFVQRDYFSWNDEALKKAKDGTTVHTDKVPDEGLLKYWFLAYDEDVFEEEFAKLLTEWKPEEPAVTEEPTVSAEPVTTTETVVTPVPTDNVVTPVPSQNLVSPKTGDDSTMILWLVIAAVSASCCRTLLIKSRKRSIN